MLNRRQALIGLGALAITPTTLAQAVEQERPSLNRLMEAIILVESRGNAQAVGDGGRAVGILQLHTGFVKDVNRIVGHDQFSPDRRLNVSASKRMFRLWHFHYSWHYNDFTCEGIARRHNGGPRGHLKRTTLGYWGRVRTLLEGGAA